jgi:voltage-gated potassium channel
MASDTETDHAHKKLTLFQLLMLLLSVYVLGALFAQATIKLSPQVTSLLETLDTIICFVFLGDFLYRLYHAPNRLAFMKWGWIDLISSIPMLDIFRWGRLVRIIRILRIMRGVRSTKYILSILLESGVRGTFTLVALVSAVVIISCSIAILHAEATPGANIKSAEDALWWSIVTITTVGYGDKFPVTTEGRMIASVLMIAGVGLFGTFTAGVASFFLRSKHNEHASDSDLMKEIRLLREHLQSIEKKLTKPEVALPAQFGTTAE